MARVRRLSGSFEHRHTASRRDGPAAVDEVTRLAIRPGLPTEDEFGAAPASIGYLAEVRLFAEIGISKRHPWRVRKLLERLIVFGDETEPLRDDPRIIARYWKFFA